MTTLNPTLDASWWQTPARVRRPSETAGSSVAFGALVAFTAILLVSPQTWFPLLKAVRIAFLAAGLAMAAHVVERTANRRPITPVSPEIAIALALVAWSILTLPMSVWPGGSIRLLSDHYLKAVAFFWLLGTIVTTTARLRTVMWTLTLCSIPLAATGVVNYLAGDFLSTGARGVYRIAGYSGVLTENPNDLALMLNLILPLTGALAFSTHGTRRLFAIAVMLLNIAAVVLTFSRAGFLTLAAMFVLLIGLLVRQKAPAAAALLVVLAICVPPLLPDGYVTRLTTIANIEADVTGSAQGRWQDTKLAARLVARNPIIGAGIGQDILVLNDARGVATWRRVHNAYLEYGVDLGVPGLLLFVWLHLTSYRTARSVEKRAATDANLAGLRPLASGVQISLVAFGVAAMFHPIAYQFYFFSVAGLAVALGTTAARARATAMPAGQVA